MKKFILLGALIISCYSVEEKQNDVVSSEEETITGLEDEFFDEQQELLKNELIGPKLPSDEEIIKYYFNTKNNCCKHCNKGIPCGDSCININKKCKKQEGCAC